MPAPRPIVGRGPDKPKAAKPKKDRWSLEDWQPSPEVQAAWERAKADGTADLHWTDTLVGKKWDGQDEWPGGWGQAPAGSWGEPGGVQPRFQQPFVCIGRQYIRNFVLIFFLPLA